MIEHLIRWSLERRWVVVALSLLVLLASAWAAARTPVDVLPDLTAPTVTVVVEGHGLAAEEMERLVTVPIEGTVNGSNGVRRVRSATSTGIAVVWVEFEWGTDVHRARQTVNERLATLASSWPSELRPPKLAPIASILGEVLFVSLTSDRHDPLELRRVADVDVRRRLLSVPGVAQVTPIGGDVRQYQVILAPALLRAHAIAAEDVVAAIESSNTNVSAGFLERGGEEAIVQGIGRIASESDLEDTLVALRGERAITVGDLGLVRVGAARKRGDASAAWRTEDGRTVQAPAVVLGIQKQPGANTLVLTRELERVLGDVEAALPAGMHVDARAFRQATFIENAVGNTTTALVEGAVMVVLVVVLFLASLRASLIALAAIPLSLGVAVLLLRALGGEINTMTLGGMAIAIGALVDDAIIDVENVVRRLRLRARMPEADRPALLKTVLDASLEVRASIVFATAIILLVFAPVFVLSGVEGRLLRPLGLAFTASLAASLLTALTLTPAACLLLLPSSRSVRAAHEPRFVVALKRLYARPLELALRRPLAFVLPALALFAWAVVDLGRAGRNFLPEFNEGALVIGITTAPGTSLDESVALATRVESAVLQEPEVVALVRRTGRAEEDEHVLGVESSEIDLMLDMGARERAGQARRTKVELLAALRERVAAVPGITSEFGQPISHRIDHMLSGTRASVTVKVFADDLDDLRRLAQQVRAEMSQVRGVVDLAVEPQIDVPAVRFELDRVAIARHGLSVEAAARALERASSGEVATRVLEGARAIDVVVRTGSAAPPTTESLAATLVETPHGARVPLGTLARVAEDATPNFVGRENGARRIVVSCNVAERDLSGLVADVRARVAAAVPLPRGAWIEYGGQFESAEETSRRVLAFGAVVLAAVAGLLVLVLRSWRDAALVLLNLPLALIGGVVGLELTGGVLSVASLIGFITVFGVAARNGILLVSHVRHLQREEGVTDVHEAVRRGAQERLAPILMTALAAGLALVPLALRGDEPGSELLTPMAIVILFGLVSSTLLNMLVVPALLARSAAPLARSAAVVAPLAALGCASVDATTDWPRARELASATAGVERVRTPDDAPAEVEAWLSDGVTRDEARSVALAVHPRLEAAFHALGVARADRVQAGLLANPSLGALFLVPSGGGRTEIQASLAQSLVDLWQLPRRLDVADRAVEASILEAARVAADLALAAGEAHDAVLAARIGTLAATENVRLAEAGLAAQRARIASGVARRSDEARAQAELEAARIDLAVHEGAVEAARNALARAMGLEADGASFEVVGELREPTMESLDPEALAARVLEERLDLRAEQALVEAARARIPLERARALPDVALVVHFERGVDGADVLGPALTLEIPVFDRGGAAIAKAEHEYLERLATWRERALEALHGVRDALAAARRARRAFDAVDGALVPAAERALDLARRARELRAVTSLEELAAQRELATARARSAAAHAELAHALAGLERACGVPWEQLERSR